MQLFIPFEAERFALGAVSAVSGLAIVATALQGMRSGCEASRRQELASRAFYIGILSFFLALVWLCAMTLGFMWPLGTRQFDGAQLARCLIWARIFLLFLAWTAVLPIVGTISALLLRRRVVSGQKSEMKDAAKQKR
jgi:hypothetical protein